MPVLSPQIILLRKAGLYTKYGMVSSLRDMCDAMKYEDLKTALAVPWYQELPEAEWANVVNWFKVQIGRKKKNAASD